MLKKTTSRTPKKGVLPWISKISEKKIPKINAQYLSGVEEISNSNTIDLLTNLDSILEEIETQITQFPLRGKQVSIIEQKKIYNGLVQHINIKIDEYYPNKTGGVKKSINARFAFNSSYFQRDMKIAEFKVYLNELFQNKFSLWLSSIFNVPVKMRNKRPIIFKLSKSHYLQAGFNFESGNFRGIFPLSSGLCYDFVWFELGEQLFYPTMFNKMKYCAPLNQRPDILFKEFGYQVNSSKPQPGNLVVYMIDNNGGEISHYGLVIDQGLVASKWGMKPLIWIHNIAFVSQSMGGYFQVFDKVDYPRLKKSIFEYVENLKNNQVLTKTGMIFKIVHRVQQEFLDHEKKQFETYFNFDKRLFYKFKNNTNHYFERESGNLKNQQRTSEALDIGDRDLYISEITSKFKKLKLNNPS